MKGQSSHLVAGSLRSFPQDSRAQKNNAIMCMMVLPLLCWDENIIMCGAHRLGERYGHDIRMMAQPYYTTTIVDQHAKTAKNNMMVVLFFLCPCVVFAVWCLLFFCCCGISTITVLHHDCGTTASITAVWWLCCAKSTRCCLPQRISTTPPFSFDYCGSVR